MRYNLFRDDDYIMSGTWDELAAYIHRTHCYSFDHALKWEGYSIHEEMCQL